MTGHLCLVFTKPAALLLTSTHDRYKQDDSESEDNEVETHVGPVNMFPSTDVNANRITERATPLQSDCEWLLR